jgi:uncharacterized protein involved in outer membrane biogenesis
MRPIRLLLLSLAVVLAALVLMAAGLYGLARLSWSDRQVAGWLGGELGLPMKVGSLALGYFPRPWLELTDVTVAAGAEDGAGAIVEIGRMKVILPWRTALGRGYAVDRLELDTPRVHLVRDAQARNWDALSARLAELLAGESIAWSLGVLELDNGSVGYRDETSGDIVELSGIGVAGRDIAPAQFFPLKARAALQSAGYIVHVALDGQAMVDPDRGAYALQAADFTGWVGGGTLPLAGVKLAAKVADANLDLAAGTAAVQGLQFDGLGVKATGRLDVAALNESPAVTFSLSSAPFAPRTIGYALGRALPATRDPAALGEAEIDLQGSWSQAGLRVEKYHGRLDDSQFTGSLWYPAGGAPPRLRADVDRIDLDRYLAPQAPEAAATSPQAAVQALMSGLEQVTLDAELTVGLAEAAGVTAHELKVALTPDETPELKP